jgi:hypothetical protein
MQFFENATAIANFQSTGKFFEFKTRDRIAANDGGGAARSLGNSSSRSYY